MKRKSQEGALMQAEDWRPVVKRRLDTGMEVAKEDTRERGAEPAGLEDTAVEGAISSSLPLSVKELSRWKQILASKCADVSTFTRQDGGEASSSQNSQGGNTSKSENKSKNHKGKQTETERELDEGEEGKEGEVRLSQSEAAELVQTIDDVIGDFNVDVPLTRADLVTFFKQLTRTQTTSTHTPSSLASKPPEDVLSLVFSQLRKAWKSAPLSFLQRTMESGDSLGWKDLNQMSLVNRHWRNIAQPLYLTELHINEPTHFPGILKLLKTDFERAGALRKLVFRMLDYDLFLSRSNNDNGFFLPEIISACPNLHHLLLERSSMSQRRTAFELDFDSITGLNLPNVIVNNCPKLRTLSYAPPCSINELALFASNLEELTSLTVLDVDPAPAPSNDGQDVVFTRLPRRLKTFWVPNAILSATQLSTLFNGGEGDIDCPDTPPIHSLAFTYDADTDFPSNQDTPSEGLEILFKLFDRIGPELRKLSLSAFSDAPDGVFRGGGFTMGLGFGLAPGRGFPPPPAGGATFQFALHTFRPPNAQNNGNGNNANGGGNNANNTGNNPATATANAGGGNNNGHGANNTANNTGNTRANNAAPGPQLPPLNHLFGGAPLNGGRGNGQNPGGGNANGTGRNGRGNGILNFPPFFFGFSPTSSSDSNTYFEDLISRCPNLVDVALYGRRYRPQLIELFKSLALRRLIFTVPEEGDRDATIDSLVEALESGLWADLEEIDLSGRGGDWNADQRWKIRKICDARKVKYNASM